MNLLGSLKPGLPAKSAVNWIHWAAMWECGFISTETDRAYGITGDRVSSPYSTDTARTCRNGHWSSPGAGALACLPALEESQFFASHLAELPKRINTCFNPDQITQLGH
jgi:hypothetical protein